VVLVGAGPGGVTPYRPAPHPARRTRSRCRVAPRV